MKKTKILIALLLAFVMAFSIVVLAACGDGDGGKKGKAIKLLMWAPSGAQTFYKEWADKWANGYTDANGVKHEGYRDADGNRYEVRMGIWAEKDVSDPLMNSPTDAADVFCFVDDQVEKLVQNNVLADLGTGSLAQGVKERDSAAAIESATYNGKLMAFPMQADNTFFLFYNSEILTEQDVANWDSLFAAVEKYNDDHKLSGDDRIKVQWNYGDTWYQASWFFSFGGTIDSTGTNFHTKDVGYKALQAAYEFSSHKDFISLDSNDQLTGGLNDGSVAAGVSGTWIYSDDLKDKIDEGTIKLAALPMIKLSDEETYRPMKNFMSCKLMGVNAQGEYVIPSLQLANFLTSYEVQLAKALELGAGPSNNEAIANEAVKSLPTVKAVAEQSKNGVAQARVPSTIFSSINICIDAVDGSVVASKQYFDASGHCIAEKVDPLLQNMYAALFPQQ